MSAVELYKPGNSLVDWVASGVYFCEECKVVYNNREQAHWCHGERLCSCGQKITSGYYRNQCHDCDRVEWAEKERKREIERFEVAVKIPESEYTGEMVYLDDRYYSSAEEATDSYLEGQEPEYVWACKNVGIPKIDLEDVICNILDNMWEDADTSDLNGVDELEKALYDFNKANEAVSVWEPDYALAILVKPN